MSQTTPKHLRSGKRQKLWKEVRADWMLYAFLIPGLLYIILFHYIPMYGVTYAFREYNPVLGPGEWY